MKRTLTKIGEFGLTIICVLFLAASALAQISLREALDFDGDNKADYLLFRPSTSVWHVRESGGGSQSQSFGFNLSTRDYVTPGDYDGDNKADFSVWRDTNGVWYRYNSSGNTFQTIQFGLPGDQPVARDYDGDGKTDLAVVRRRQSSCTDNGSMVWFVLRSSDGGYSVTQFGYATDFAAPGDYDGDGKFDLAVQRPETSATATDCLKVNPKGQSVFYFKRSSDNIIQGVTFNLSNDLVVPGDYDGDGKTDIAVVREGVTSSANMIWYIQQSCAGLKVASYGLTGFDKTAQADYDGDGKTDIAIWREADEHFHILRSSNNGYYTFLFGNAGDFPVAGHDTH